MSASHHWELFRKMRPEIDASGQVKAAYRTWESAERSPDKKAAFRALCEAILQCLREQVDRGPPVVAGSYYEDRKIAERYSALQSAIVPVRDDLLTRQAAWAWENTTTTSASSTYAVLDLGSGDGSALAAVVQQRPDHVKKEQLKLVASDRSEAMVVHHHSRFSELGAKVICGLSGDLNRKEFANQEIYRETWPSGCFDGFDVIICSTVAHLVRDRDALYAAIRGLLKSSGIVVIGGDYLDAADRKFVLAESTLCDGYREHRARHPGSDVTFVGFIAGFLFRRYFLQGDVPLTLDQEVNRLRTVFSVIMAEKHNRYDEFAVLAASGHALHAPNVEGPFHEVATEHKEHNVVAPGAVVSGSFVAHGRPVGAPMTLLHPDVDWITAPEGPSRALEQIRAHFTKLLIERIARPSDDPDLTLLGGKVRRIAGEDLANAVVWIMISPAPDRTLELQDSLLPVAMKMADQPRLTAFLGSFLSDWRGYLVSLQRELGAFQTIATACEELSTASMAVFTNHSEDLAKQMAQLNGPEGYVFSQDRWVGARQNWSPTKKHHDLRDGLSNFVRWMAHDPVVFSKMGIDPEAVSGLAGDLVLYSYAAAPTGRGVYAEKVRMFVALDRTYLATLHLPRVITAMRDTMATIAADIVKVRESLRLGALSNLHPSVRDGANTGGTDEHAFVGESAAARKVLADIDKYASAGIPGLLLGETGTGKEVAARRLHALSGLKGGFVALSCADLAPQLVESELFGHRKGAFTGAVADRPGLFRTADGGTLFLDEIGELPLSLQGKLLRTIQEKEVRPAGEDRPVRVNVRLICATNRDLTSEVRAGRFKADLYHRIRGFQIEMPPLRERREDIPLLVNHFLRRAPSNGPTGIADDALRLLSDHSWPGNIRDLFFTVERLILAARGRVISVTDVNEDLRAYAMLQGNPGDEVANRGANITNGATGLEYIPGGQTSNCSVCKAKFLVDVNPATIKPDQIRQLLSELSVGNGTFSDAELLAHGALRKICGELVSNGRIDRSSPAAKTFDALVTRTGFSACLTGMSGLGMPYAKTCHLFDEPDGKPKDNRMNVRVVAKQLGSLVSRQEGAEKKRA
jgi:DNA-binding NtrC family response regulator/SAM-dependent methyltransferase